MHSPPMVTKSVSSVATMFEPSRGIFERRISGEKNVHNTVPL